MPEQQWESKMKEWQKLESVNALAEIVRSLDHFISHKHLGPLTSDQATVVSNARNHLCMVLFEAIGK
jgi:hypothetical protein